MRVAQRNMQNIFAGRDLDAKPGKFFSKKCLTDRGDDAIIFTAPRRYLSWIEGLTTNQNVTGSNPVRRTSRTSKVLPGTFFIRNPLRGSSLTGGALMVRGGASPVRGRGATRRFKHGAPYDATSSPTASRGVRFIASRPDLFSKRVDGHACRFA